MIEKNDKNKNSISVIIPTLNRIKFLDRALKSVIRQSLSPDEIIVVDNGSTDNTVKQIKKKYPEVRILKEKKIGVSSARNKGIKEAKCEWIAFLDSDDEWLSQKLEKQINFIKDEKENILIHSDEYWIKNKKHMNQKKKHKKKGGFIFNECLKICCISPSSTIIKKNTLLEIGLFDENLFACEDYDLWLRLSAFYPVHFVDEKLIIKYGGHDDQLSNKYWGMDRFRIYSIEKILTYPNLSEEKRENALKVLKEKIEIVLNGAKKRNNKKIEKYYMEKLLKIDQNYQ